MIDRLHMTAIVAVAIGTMSVLLLLSGEPVSWKALLYIGTTAGFTFFAAHQFDKWIWRWRLWRGWLVKRPNLHGTWEAELRSSWKDPATGEAIKPIKARVAIRQTLTEVFVRLDTSESSGDLVAGRLLAQDDGTFRLAAIYQNDPRASVRERSSPHFGALWLNVVGEPQEPTELVGRYWTDRGTTGEFKAVRA